MKETSHQRLLRLLRATRPYINCHSSPVARDLSKEIDDVLLEEEILASLDHPAPEAAS